MKRRDRPRLLRHLHEQTSYVLSLTTYACGHPDDAEVLVRIRDEVFTLRETLDTLRVPHALMDNAGWDLMPHASHRSPWPSASDLPD